MTNQQNIDTEPAGEIKPRRNWNGWDVFFFVAPCVCIILVPLGGFDYLCGRFFPLFYSFLICLVYPAIFILFLFLMAMNIIRLFYNYRKHAPRKKVLIITGLIAPIVLGASFVIHNNYSIELKLHGPNYKSFTSGFGDQIKSRTDIPAIRDWLKTLEPEDYSSDNIITLQKNYPKSLMILKPSVICVSADENGNAKANLSWGSSYAGTWGVVFGMEDMKIPPSDFSRHGECRLPVEAGVYVWHDMR